MDVKGLYIKPKGFLIRTLGDGGVRHNYNHSRGPEGYEGSAYQSKKVSGTDSCEDGGHARLCQGLDQKDMNVEWSFIIPRARLQRQRPHKTDVRIHTDPDTWHVGL